jgi:hypothetical protein
MKHDRHNQDGIDKRIGMQNQSPIGFLVLGHQEKRSEKLYSQQSDEQQPGHTVKNPYKHGMHSFSGGYIKLKLVELVKKYKTIKMWAPCMPLGRRKG